MNDRKTLPASRTLTKEKEDIVKAELNLRSKTQEIATKLIEVRKQRRGLDKTAARYEKELADIFDSQGIESMEIEIGLLVRRKGEKGTEWFVEL